VEVLRARGIKRRDLFFAMPLAVIATQKKTYKYRCPKCNLIQEYATPGINAREHRARMQVMANTIQAPHEMS